jgi:uncharacterized glyoxalase superfamily protein PhnB
MPALPGCNEAIRWLREAFGFTEILVVAGPEGTIAHAELGWRTGVIMLGSGTREPFDKVGMASVYVIVDDPDVHYQRAVAAGAEIVLPLKDEDYGSRDYTARDPEGNLWSFGTYRVSGPDS